MKPLVLLLLLLPVAHAAVPLGYSYQRAITIDHTRVPNTDLANFPLLISGTYVWLATTANGGQVQSPNGYDIIFTADQAGAQRLDHEIETWRAADGKLDIWVRITATAPSPSARRTRPASGPPAIKASGTSPMEPLCLPTIPAATPRPARPELPPRPRRARSAAAPTPCRPSPLRFPASPSPPGST